MNYKYMSKRKKQKGGNITSIPQGSTSSDISAMFNDMIGTLEYGILATVDAIEAVTYAIELPSDFGKAFDASDPSPDSVSAPPMKKSN